MCKSLLSFLSLFFVAQLVMAQPCEITSINATPLACDGNYFLVTVDLDVSNPSSPGFTLAGNGVIYGTYLYTDLPVTVGPFLGDNESSYEFIAWDVENGDCQQYVDIPAVNCGPICDFSNPELVLVECSSQLSALVTFDFEYENVTNPAFDLFYENGSEVGSYLYQSLPITIPFFVVNGAAPITLTICDNNNIECCETFSFDAIDCNLNNCEIVNIIADPQCIGNNFIVHLDFDFSGPVSDSFTVQGNSLNYGTFAYGELPLTLGPLNGSSNINWEFIVHDVGNPDCQGEDVLGVYHCPPPCNLEAVIADVTACASDSTYVLELGVEIEGEGDLGFSVISENYYYGTYSYDDLPVLINSYSGSGEYLDTVTICDNQNPGCCSVAAYEAFLCAGCVIDDLSAVPQPCNGEDELMVEIDFYHYNTSATFEVSGNGDNFGTFEYDDLPVLVGPFPGDGSVFLEFVISDSDDPLCFAALEVGQLTCDEICELSNLVVETGDCTGDDTYVAHINFNYQGVTGIGFDLFVNGELYDFYSYDDLPLTIEEFPSNGSGVDVVTVCENDNPDCCTTLEFAAPDCGCAIFETTFEELGCTSDSTFAIALEFFSENTPNQNVDIYLDGVYWGFYEADNLPLIIDNIPDGDGVIELTVCASDQNDCCDNIVIEQIQCEGAECAIWDLIAGTGDCNSDSTYVLEFEFNHINFPSDSITVTANGEYIGQYIIEPDFNRIENFPVLAGNEIHLVICAAGAPDCCADVNYVAPNCELFGQCHIFDLVADAGECQSDSTYLLHLLFEFDNLPTDSVVITTNGNPFGTYHVQEGHIILEHFPEYETNHTVVTICAQGAPDCCDVIEFETLQCGEQSGCEIWDLIGIVEDCQSDTSYLLHIEFNFNDLPTDSVAIIANGNLLGHYQVHEGSIFLEHFPVFGTPNTVVQVCAVGAPDCCDIIEFDTPNCENGGTCHLYDLVADPGDCMSDSTYVLFIHYFGNNFPGDSIVITANGQYIGTFADDPDGFGIEDFPEFNTDLTTITVCAAGNEDCCDSFQFITPNCGEECHIVDLVVDPGACNGDSSAYSLFVHYVAINLPGDSVVVTTNEGAYVGTFIHNADGFIIPEFPLWQGNHTVVLICAQGAPDCCDVFEFETPNCGQGVDCHFHEVFAEHGPCTSDSTYVVDIVFDLINGPSDSVLIFANDSFLGQYLIDPEYIHIENFPHLPGETTTITICAVGAPDCCATYVLEVPSCGDCYIDITEINAFNCTSDSTFAAVIHIAYENINGGGFDLWAGDHYLGFFTLDELPAEIGQFPSNETGNYVVTVCENDNAECCVSAEFEGPTCPQEDCHIFDLVYTMTECDSNGHFFFILDFQFDNVGDDGFTIAGNGNNYGTFSYDSLPIVLGPFEDGETNWEFIVHDVSHPDCFDVALPGVVTCEVATEDVSPDDYFQIFNNGTIPGILAKKDVVISLTNANGQVLYHDRRLTTESYFELLRVPDGFYIATVRYEQYIWPVKLIRTGN